MSDLKIVTNNVPRNTIYWHGLTASEQEWFDYLKTEDEQVQATFFRYRGNAYDLGEFSRVSWGYAPSFIGWELYQSDSYFSGIVVRFVDDGDRIVCGFYYC